VAAMTFPMRHKPGELGAIAGMAQGTG
jgi:hypothetical protein